LKERLLTADHRDHTIVESIEGENVTQSAGKTVSHRKGADPHKIAGVGNANASGAVPSPVVEVYLPFVGANTAGLLRFAKHLLEALSDAGVEVRVICGQVDGDVEWISRYNPRVLFPSKFLRGRAMRVTMHMVRLCWLQFVFPLRRLRSGTRTATLMLAHESAPFPFRNQVAVVHDLTVIKPYSGTASYLHAAQHRIWLAGLRRSRNVVTVSDATREDLIRNYPELRSKTLTILEGVDRATFHERNLESDQEVLSELGISTRYLLYSGTLAPHKNVPVLMPILSALVREGRDIEFLITGRHSIGEQDVLLDEARKHDVADRVRFVGYLTDEQLAALMRHCASFVFPSLNEGFGLAPVEAMSCGAPVVSSPEGSLKEVIASGGVLCPPLDQKAWLNALRSVLDDEGTREEIRNRGVARAQELSWKAAAKEYKAVLFGVEKSGT
jgi:glycosyltransferase involved in cell wall biosynthesis